MHKENLAVVITLIASILILGLTAKITYNITVTFIRERDDCLSKSMKFE